MFASFRVTLTSAGWSCMSFIILNCQCFDSISALHIDRDSGVEIFANAIALFLTTK